VKFLGSLNAPEEKDEFENSVLS
jgi:4'-phosphopantetheinyl transferase EntD